MHPHSALNRSHTFKLIAVLSCTACSVAFWFLYFSLYWPHRERFNEAGRYIDETTMVVYHQQSGLLVIPAVASSVLALVLAYFWRAARKLHCANRELQS